LREEIDLRGTLIYIGLKLTSGRAGASFCTNNSPRKGLKTASEKKTASILKAVLNIVNREGIPFGQIATQSNQGSRRASLQDLILIAEGRKHAFPDLVSGTPFEEKTCAGLWSCPKTLL